MSCAVAFRVKTPDVACPDVGAVTLMPNGGVPSILPIVKAIGPEVVLFEAGSYAFAITLWPPFVFSAGPAGDVHAQLDVEPGLLTLRTGSSTHTVRLPGECTIGAVVVSARLVAVPGAARGAMPIEEYFPDVISLTGGNRIVLGSASTDNEFDVFLPNRSVAPVHCILVRQPPVTAYYWIADAGSAQGTFVNRRLIIACQLHQGDLVQVGAYAWVFNLLEGVLVPVKGLCGAELELHNVRVANRLDELNWHVVPGQLVAITGQSGGGKSTLVRAILEGGAAGRIVANGHDVSIEREWFRTIVGYVPQQDVIHGDLTAQQAVEFSGELRGVTRMETPLKRLLSQLELSERVRDTNCRQLSGGESKRVRTAAALISEPQLLVLDEPASGLDRGREASLMRLLRTLSFRGCTVVVVTHSLHNLDVFDRILVLRERQRVFWGTPDELKARIPSGNLEDLDLRKVTENKSAATTETTAANAPSPSPSGLRRQNAWSQTRTLLRRELTLLQNAPLRRLAIPLGVLPVFFAVSIGWSVKQDDLHLLGFLSILACIWMGSSLSLMSIVNEREVFDYEQLLFLRVTPYVVAKTAVLWLLSIVQTAIFLLVLSLVRSSLHGRQGMLFEPLYCAAALSAVGLAAVGLGLLISALAGTNRPLAGFILPLAMMTQIVFSIQVAGNQKAPLVEAYGEFTPHRCHSPGCPRRARFWRTSEDTGSCAWTCGTNHATSVAVERPELLAKENADRPNLWAASASYATISRYGDILLRSFAYQSSADTPSSGVDADPPISPWQRESLGVLLLLSVALPALVIPILSWPARHQRQG